MTFTYYCFKSLNHYAYDAGVVMIVWNVICGKSKV